MEYRRFPSIKQYLVLDQDDRAAQPFARTDLGWHEVDVEGVIEFAGTCLDLDAAYDVVERKPGAS